MTDVTRLIAPADTTLTARGDSDDTFSVHLATSSPTAACLDDDDCSAGEWRWLMIELPTGGGLQLGAKYAIAGGWFMGAAPLDEDKPSPPMTMQQDGYWSSRWRFRPVRASRCGAAPMTTWSSDHPTGRATPLLGKSEKF
jgi:hypothetical protein